MITLKSNTANLVGRFFMLILIAVIVYLVVTNNVIKTNKQREKILFACFLLTILLALIPVVISFFGILKVEVDKSTALITLSGLFSTRVIYNKEITGYYNSFSQSRRKTFYGIILLLDNNESFELVEYNLRSIGDFEQYLKETNIKNLGKRRSRFPLKGSV